MVLSYLTEFPRSFSLQGWDSSAMRHGMSASPWYLHDLYPKGLIAEEVGFRKGCFRLWNAANSAANLLKSSPSLRGRLLFQNSQAHSNPIEPLQLHLPILPPRLQPGVRLYIVWLSSRSRRPFASVITMHSCCNDRFYRVILLLAARSSLCCRELQLSSSSTLSRADARGHKALP